MKLKQWLVAKIYQWWAVLARDKLLEVRTNWAVLLGATVGVAMGWVALATMVALRVPLMGIVVDRVGIVYQHSEVCSAWGECLPPIVL